MNKIQYMYQSINVYIDTLLRRLLQQIFFFYVHGYMLKILFIITLTSFMW